MYVIRWMTLLSFPVGSSLDMLTVQGDVRSNILEVEETSEMLHQASSLDMKQTLPSPKSLQPLIKNAVQEGSEWANFGSSILRETWTASMSYLKSDSRLPLVLGVIGLAVMLILMQVFWFSSIDIYEENS